METTIRIENINIYWEYIFHNLKCASTLNDLSVLGHHDCLNLSFFEMVMPTNILLGEYNWNRNPHRIFFYHRHFGIFKFIHLGIFDRRLLNFGLL